MINVAVIGAGRIGRVHIENLVRNRLSCLKVICDTHDQVGKRLAFEFGTEFSTLPDEIIGNKEIDAVYICTPAHTHVDLMEAALAKGKYVFCEKPIDEDLEKAKRFVYANSARAAKIMIGFHRRFDQTHLHLRETIHSGSLGQIEQIVINSRDPAMESYDVLTFTGGIFRDMTLHDIDQASVLLGRATFTGVFARTACLVDPTFAQRDDFDNAVATFWTETGVTCTILNSRRSAFGFEQNIEVFCSKGSASLNTPTGMTFTVRDQRGTNHPAPIGHFLERYHAAYEKECQAFLEAIQHGKEFPVSALDGINALRLADAADRSARLGQPVAIEA
jgi:myo-inositol 2-dehydrogenase / D-chiro-inositol 1-dehydrogenase